MARPARGSENLELAREVLARAQTVEQLRQAQAVVLPLDYGLSWSKRRGRLAARCHGHASCAIASSPVRSLGTVSASPAAGGGART